MRKLSRGTAKVKHDTPSQETLRSPQGAKAVLGQGGAAQRQTASLAFSESNKHADNEVVGRLGASARNHRCLLFLRFRLAASNDAMARAKALALLINGQRLHCRVRELPQRRRHLGNFRQGDEIGGSALALRASVMDV